MKSAFVRGCLVVSGVVFPASVGAQTSVVVPDAATCARCTISTRTILSLGSVDGPGALRGHGSVMTDSRGRYWVFGSDAVPMVFAADGQFLQMVGTIGQGPGEFLGTGGAFQVPGDSLVVLDNSAHRATVIGPDLRIGRMIKLPANLAADAVVVRWPDTVIAGGIMRTRERTIIPLHTVSLTGTLAELVRDFGQDDSATPPAMNPAAYIRLLTPARSGGAWTAEYGNYRLTLWTAAGVKVRTLERKPAWFVPSSDLFAGNPTTPPPATIAAIREDPSTGLIWVFANVAARTWRETWPAGSVGARETSVQSIAWEKLWDTRVEVLDPSAGRVVAAGSVPGAVRSVLRDGRVAIYTVDGDDIPRMKIVELRLEGWTPPARRPR